jgi:hypothetical protein
MNKLLNEMQFGNHSIMIFCDGLNFHIYNNKSPAQENSFVKLNTNNQFVF